MSPENNPSNTVLEERKESNIENESLIPQDLQWIVDRYKTPSYEEFKEESEHALKFWNDIYMSLKSTEYDGDVWWRNSSKINSLDRQATESCREVEKILGTGDAEEEELSIIPLLGGLDNDKILEYRLELENACKKGFQERRLLLTQLANDATFEGRQNLSRFLSNRLWTTSGRLGRSANFLDNNNPQYDIYREKISPYIRDSMTTLATVGGEEDLVALRESLEYLISIRESDIATEVLIQKDIDDGARLRLAVENMNVLGVVPTIEELLKHVNDNPDVLKTVKTIQNVNGAEIMTTLSAVYQAVEFGEYALNNIYLTKAEVDRVRYIVEERAKKKNVSPEQVRIADIGAGVGRHSILLQKQGLNVTAYEKEDKHIQQIKKDAPDLKVVQADWYKMPLPKATENTSSNPEVIFCFGRTILHNNTPEKMARFFDEMHRILEDNGEGIIDIPEVPELTDESGDDYSQNIKEYFNHLESLGVLPQRARNIYDGPDVSHRYNRMAVTQFQFESYARLFGFKVEKVDTIPIEEKGLFDNSYYRIEKDPDFDIANIPTREMFQMLHGVGLYHPSVDYNVHVDAWGVPLGVPFVYASGLRGTIEDLREQVKEGKLPPIRFEVNYGRLVFMM